MTITKTSPNELKPQLHVSMPGGTSAPALVEDVLARFCRPMVPKFCSGTGTKKTINITRALDVSERTAFSFKKSTSFWS